MSPSLFPASCWYLQLLSGWSRQKLSIQFILLYPVQQSRQQVLRAYCPNIYTVLFHHTVAFFSIHLPAVHSFHSMVMKKRAKLTSFFITRYEFIDKRPPFLQFSSKISEFFFFCERSDKSSTFSSDSLLLGAYFLIRMRHRKNR